MCYRCATSVGLPLLLCLQKFCISHISQHAVMLRTLLSCCFPVLSSLSALNQGWQPSCCCTLTALLFIPVDCIACSIAITRCPSS